MNKKDTFITKDSGNHMSFSTGMKRDISEDKPRFDLLIPNWIPFEEQFLTRFANHMARGAKKYSERNREVAETQEELNRFKESFMRHAMQWFCGDRSEDHCCAAAFNLMGAEMVLYKLKQKSDEQKN